VRLVLMVVVVQTVGTTYRLAAQLIQHAGVREVICLPHAVRQSGWYIGAVGWS